jgi:choline dehydrogenase-like flavoprotein
MLDVGTQRPSTALPAENFIGLKEHLPDPVSYFLGPNFEGADLPDGIRSDYYNIPAAKHYVFEAPIHFRYVSHGIAPLISFAAGGLAEAWTGGCYPLNDTELRDFPFCHEDINPYYAEIAGRIGIGGEDDDLAQFFPHHEHLSAAVALDESSARLLSRYEKARNVLTPKYGIYMGRSRQAALAEPRQGRDGCRYCGRCLWGCPNGALYTPAMTLQQCAAYKNFNYRAGLFASHFHFGPTGLIDELIAFPVKGGPAEPFRADVYVLACGTLSTSNLLLRSIYKSTGEIIRLAGLTENRQVLSPFFNFAMLGQCYQSDSYQYHQLAIGLTSQHTGQYVHGQITPLKTATVHPLIRRLPFDMRSSLEIFSNLRAGLGVLNLNFCDWRRDENFLTLARDHDGASDWPQLRIHYAPPPAEGTAIQGAITRIRRFFYDLGAPFIPGLTQWRPLGTSVHYSGTLPMSREKRALCVSATCQSYDIPNMFVVDGAVMPFLPAKNITFTLMANAIRVAAKIL